MNDESTLFEVISFVSASVFVTRNFVNEDFFGIDQRYVVPIIVTTFFLAPFLIISEFQIEFSILNICMWIVWLFTLLLPGALMQKRISEVRGQYFWIVNRVIIEIKSGKSFRSSFNHSLSALSQNFAEWKVEIGKFVTFPQHLLDEKWNSNAEDQLFLRTMSAAFHSSSHSLIILESYREHMTVLRNFRRRSRQVTVQIRAQMIVMVILYVGALIYFLKKYDEELSGFLWCSLSLFFVGLVLVFLLGRKTKWST